MPTIKALATGTIAGLIAVPVAFFGYSALATPPPPATPTVVIPSPPATPPAPTASATTDPGLLPVFFASDDTAEWEGVLTSLEVTGGSKAGADGYTAVADIPLYDLAVFDLCEDITATFGVADITVLNPAGVELAFPGTGGICLLAGTVKEYPIEGEPPWTQPDTTVPDDGIGIPGTPPETTVPAGGYENCAAVWAELGRPIFPADAGYSRDLDRDGDGTGCEQDPR